MILSLNSVNIYVSQESKRKSENHPKIERHLVNWWWSIPASC
jgi:hypothetical protein